MKFELDKTRPVVNQPVSFRRKDGGWGGTQVVAEILDHGQPATGISNAVFMCTKPDKKYVRDGAVSVNGNVLTYTLNNEVGTCPGVIRLAYFQINNTVSTQNFQINVADAISPASQSDNYDAEIRMIQKSMINASQEEIDQYKTLLGSARNNYIYTNNGKIVLSKINKTLTLPPAVTVTIGNKAFGVTNVNQVITFKDLVEFVIFNIDTRQIEVKVLDSLSPNEVVLGYFDLNNNNALINIKDNFLVDENGNAINKIEANQIPDNSLTRRKLSFYKSIGGGSGGNLYDPATMNEGSTLYIDSQDPKFKPGQAIPPNTISGVGNDWCSLKIPVSPNTTYKRGIHHYESESRFNASWITFWDESLNYLTSLYDICGRPSTSVDEAHRYFFTTPDNCYYVRITCQEKYAKTFTFFQTKNTSVGNIQEGYIDEKLYITKSHVIDENSVENIKTLDCDGDSITYGAFTNHSYVYYFQKLIGERVSVTNSGINGATIAKSGAPSFIYETYIKDLNKNADMITILAGTNDYAQHVPISNDENSIDITTFNGALNVLMTGLLTNFSSKIVFLTPIRSSAPYAGTGEWDRNINKNKVGLTLRDYCDCIIKMGKKYGIEVIDWNNNLGLNPKYEASAKYFNTDKLHPNDLGHQFMAHQLFKDIGNYLI